MYKWLKANINWFILNEGENPNSLCNPPDVESNILWIRQHTHVHKSFIVVVVSYKWEISIIDYY